jgi:hypothetical protein
VCKNHKEDTSKLYGENAQLRHLVHIIIAGLCSVEVRSLVLSIFTDLLCDERNAVYFCTLLGKYVFHILTNITLESTANANHNSFGGKKVPC